MSDVVFWSMVTGFISSIWWEVILFVFCFFLNVFRGLRTCHFSRQTSSRGRWLSISSKWNSSRGTVIDCGTSIWVRVKSFYWLFFQLTMVGLNPVHMIHITDHYTNDLCGFSFINIIHRLKSIISSFFLDNKSYNFYFTFPGLFCSSKSWYICPRIDNILSSK